MASVGLRKYVDYYREFNCAVCGVKAIDRSPTQSRLYCSDSCCYKAYRINKGIVKGFVTQPCIHNVGVLCDRHKCSTCGWNPRVEAKRKEALCYGR